MDGKGGGDLGITALFPFLFFLGGEDGGIWGAHPKSPNV